MSIDTDAYRMMRRQGYKPDQIREYFMDNNLSLDVVEEELQGGKAETRELRSKMTAESVDFSNGENPDFMGMDRNNPVVRGLRDAGGGVAQALVKAIDGPEEAQKFTGWENDNIQQYEEQRRKDGGKGIDWDRFGGQVAPGVLAPIGKTLPGKVGLGAEAGALAGGAMFSPSGDNLAQVAGGGLGGAAFGLAGHYAAPFAKNLVESARKPLRAFGGMMRDIGKRFSPSTADDVGAAVSRSIQDAGINLNDVTEDMANNIRTQVTAAMDAGQDPAAAARKAVMNAAGFVDDTAPTQAQMSMSPQAWRDERELSKLAGGEPLQERFSNQNQQFRNQTGEMGAGMGGTAADDVAASQAVSDNILTQWRDSQKHVSNLYNKASKDIPEGSAAALTNFQTKIQELWELGKDETVPQLKQAWSQLKRNGLDSEGNTLVPVSPFRMEEMKKSLQSGWENMDSSQRMVVRELVESLNDDMDTLGNPFQKARAAGAERFQRFGNDLVKSVIDGKVSGKNFISTKILGGKPEDISELKLTLNALDPQAWADIKSRTFDFFMRKSYGGNPNSEFAQFSGKQLGKAMENRDSVLLQIFDENELAMMKNLAKSGEWMMSDRPFSGVNTSNTASTVIRGLQSAGGRIPGIKQAIQGAQHVGNEVAAGGALNQMPPMQSSAVPGFMGGATEQILRKAGVPIVPNLLTEGEQQ